MYFLCVGYVIVANQGSMRGYKYPQECQTTESALLIRCQMQSSSKGMMLNTDSFNHIQLHFQCTTVPCNTTPLVVLKAGIFVMLGSSVQHRKGSTSGVCWIFNKQNFFGLSQLIRTLTLSQQCALAARSAIPVSRCIKTG